MRKIKFRAWDNDIGVMITQSRDYHLSVLSADIGENHWDGSIGEQTAKEAERFKIMQYTGRKDKNGADIYDGDLLGIPGDPREPVEVFWSDRRSAFLLRNASKTWSEYFSDRNWDDHQVIGNIYENPELLESKQ